jgi:hypothetical protein
VLDLGILGPVRAVLALRDPLAVVVTSVIRPDPRQLRHGKRPGLLPSAPFLDALLGHGNCHVVPVQDFQDLCQVIGQDGGSIRLRAAQPDVAADRVSPTALSELAIESYQDGLVHNCIDSQVVVLILICEPGLCGRPTVMTFSN